MQSKNEQTPLLGNISVDDDRDGSSSVSYLSDDNNLLGVYGPQTYEDSQQVVDLPSLHDLGDYIEVEKRGKSSIQGAVFNLTNVILGSGIIGFPHAYAEAGLLVGLGLHIFMAWLTSASLDMLIKAGLRSGKYDYEELALHCFGRTGYLLNLFFVFLLDFGSMVTYVLIIADTLPSIAYYYTGFWLFDQRSYSVWLMATLIMLPPSLLRHLHELSVVSFMSVGSVMFIIVVIGLEGIAMRSAWDHHPPTVDKHMELVGRHIFSAVGIMAFGFVCHDVAFLVFRSLKEPTMRKWRKTTKGTVGLAFLASLAMGLFGYFSFFSHAKGNILNNFPHHLVLVNVTRVLLGLTMIMVFPMNLFVTRHVLKKCFGYSSAEDLSTTLHFGSTLVLFGAAVAIGTFVRDLGKVQALVGGLSAVAVAYIMPAACVLMVSKQIDGTIWLWRNAECFLLLLIGGFTMVLSTTDAIIDITAMVVKSE
eukprot:Clim_evm52s243 gene=Clim_evmTU52s243